MKQLDHTQRELAGHLKATIYLTVSKIIDQEIANINLQNGSRNLPDVSASPRFIASLVELVYNQAINLGEDLESFAIHGGRKTVTPEDMYMVTRRNEVLTGVLREVVER